MNTKKVVLALAVALAFASTGASPAFAHPEGKVKGHGHSGKHGRSSMMMASPTPEMRQNMAEMHQKMADCLKSERPMAECRKEMMKNCPMKGKGHCPMMESDDES
jgi:Spy/CpxP family protein refolding chaperone